MKLYILKNDGTLHEVVENLEEYDLNKPIPRIALIEEIRLAIENISNQDYEDFLATQAHKHIHRV